MTAIALRDKEIAIREKLIKAASDGNKVYYSDLLGEEDTSLVRSLGGILEKITQYDIENKQPILALLLSLNQQAYPMRAFLRCAIC